jgi:NTP pyrophosphatase (non-canonical NTP hydrolase)
MKDFESKILKYLQARGWDKLRPGDLAKSIAIESGELLEIFQWDNPELSDVRKNKEKREHLAKELADIMIYCFDISVLMGFDTEKILRKKLAAAEKKYPAKLMKNRTKDPGTEDLYWKIKKEHRMKGLS